MLVSIIIPAYNAEKYMDEAIQSALDQTYSDIEVIVVDDGSTDKTWWKLCHQWRKEGVKTLTTRENKGPATALNMGIKYADGEWIKWLSADDVLEPDAIELIMKNIEGVPVDEWSKSIYYTHYKIIDKDGKFIKVFTEPERRESDLWKLFYGNGSTSLIHRDVFKLCGLFDENLRHSEDYEYWLRATQLYGVHLKLIPEYTLKYRRHAGQLTNTVGGSLDQTIKDSIRKRLTTLQH